MAVAGKTLLKICKICFDNLTINLLTRLKYPVLGGNIWKSNILFSVTSSFISETLVSYSKLFVVIEYLNK